MEFTSISKTFAWSGIVLGTLLFASGCHQFRVDSYPDGAKIIVDGQDTSEVTPKVFSPRHFSTGMHRLTVEKHGYSTVTPPQLFWVEISVVDVIFSWVPPILLKNALHNHWKNKHGRIQPFYLKEGESVGVVPISREESKPTGTEGTIPAKLKQLNLLKEQGLITEDEYAVKRKAILDSI